MQRKRPKRTIARLMLFFTGDVATSRAFSKDAYGRAVEPKTLVSFPGAGHVDFRAGPSA